MKGRKKLTNLSSNNNESTYFWSTKKTSLTEDTARWTRWCIRDTLRADDATISADVTNITQSMVTFSKRVDTKRTLKFKIIGFSTYLLQS